MSARAESSIGAVARATGLSEDTLRYYEREGLVSPVPRGPGGQRTYGEHDVAWIGLVSCLRDAGLGIADLREFTALLRGDSEPQERVAFLRTKRDVLLERSAALATALAVLEEKIAHFSTDPR